MKPQVKGHFAGCLYVCVIAGFLFVVGHARAAERTARADFMNANPCPANGKTAGACPGYVIDHLIPLMCGGRDDPANMQWQTLAEAKAKDKWDTIGCRRGRRPQLITPVENVVEVFPYGVSDVRPRDLGAATAPVTSESAPEDPEMSAPPEE